MTTPEGDIQIQTPLLGRINISNALAASAACWQLGVRGAAIQRGLARFRGVPGRMEAISAGQPFGVIVDYAHTPDALEKVLISLREMAGQGRVILLFGCGGDRDRGKRALMGRVAGRLADLLFVTDDNPRSESPEEIRQSIIAGCRQEKGAWREVGDRAVAIAEALAAVRPGDLLLIAGKGHETVQILACGAVPFADQQVARRGLAKMGYDKRGGDASTTGS